MSTQTWSGRIKTRHATEAEWSSGNPVLLEGEIALSTDKNNRYKVGDGTTNWSDLGYAGYQIGSNITLTGDTLSISKSNVTNALGYTPPSQNTTYAAYDGSQAGLVPVAASGNSGKFLRGDGAWETPANTTYAEATDSAAGLMSASDKSKLTGIAANANNYTLPGATSTALGGIQLSGTATSYLNGNGAWTTPADTTYANATTNSAGLMSADDKTKIDTVATGANNYTLPAASSSALGGVQLSNAADQFLNGTGNWTSPVGTTYASLKNPNAITINQYNGTASPTATTYDGSSTKTLDVAGKGAVIDITRTGTTFTMTKADGTTDTFDQKDGSTNLGDMTGTLGVAHGGTGATTLSVGQVLIGNGTDAITTRAIDTTSGGTENSTSLITSGAVYAGLSGKLSSSLKGVANGLAELGSDGKVPTSQLPSFVDDVVEGYLSGSIFYKESSHTTAITAESGKIYVDLSNNKSYRWSGTTYVEISASLTLGNTSATAYRGDYGEIAYNHSQTAHAPSDAQANQNAFSTVSVGSTSIAADTPTDTLTFTAGDNITLTPDATADKITIAATNTTYAAVSTAANGLAPALSGVATQFLNGSGSWTTPADTTYAGATTGAAGLAPALSGNSGQYLNGSGSWTVPANTTYAGATTAAAGLAPKLSGNAGQYLNGSGTWTVPTNTTYAAVSSSAAGLAPTLPNNAAQYLNGIGGWSAPVGTTYATATTSAAGLMSADDKKNLDAAINLVCSASQPAQNAQNIGDYWIQIETS